MADTSPTTPRRSPLQALAGELAAASSPDLTIHEVPFRAMVALRCDPAGGAAERVAAALGGPLPTTCGGDAHGAVWMGPDEWLVITNDDPETLLARLETALAGSPGAVVDVSSNRTTVAVEGPRARHLLDKGCSIDLHPRAFPVGHAVPTDLAGVQVVVRRLGPETWHVLPRCSFADHLVRWMMVNAQEYSHPRGG